MTVTMRQWIAAQSWTFARSMPKVPHWYVLRSRSDPGEFDRARAYVEGHGRLGRWHRKAPNHYLDLDGFRYWVLEGRNDEVVLNRERIEDSEVVWE